MALLNIMVHCIVSRTDTLIGDILDGFGIMANGIKIVKGLHKKRLNLLQ